MSLLMIICIPVLIFVPFLNIYNPVLCIPILFDINEKVLESMLQQAKQLKRDDFIIWNIKDGLPVLFGKNQTQGVSQDDWLIILERIRENEEEWNLCYWIPKYLPQYYTLFNEQNDFTVAAYTMALDQVLNENFSYHYSRESKGVFRNQEVDMFTTCLNKGVHKRFSLFRSRRFILIEEQNVIVIRQTLSLSDYLYGDSCAVFYAVRVYFFCGDGNISDRLRSAANALGELVKEEVQKYDPYVRYIEMTHGIIADELSEQEREEIAEFYILAGYNNNFDVPELEDHYDSNSFIMRTLWESQYIINLSTNTDDVCWYTISQKGPLFKSMLKTDECHIILSKAIERDIIFFLWIGTESTIESRIRAAINVEQTVQHYYQVNVDRSNLYKMTATVVVEGKEPLEFMSMFIDWIDLENHNYIESLLDDIGIFSSALSGIYW